MRPLNPLLEGATCVLGQESLEHCRQHHRARIVCNALMAAEPGHPFFCSVTEQLPAYAANPDPVQPVLTTTGPFMLSDVYERFAGKNTITLMPPDYFYPLSMQQADKARTAGLPVELPRHMPCITMSVAGGSQQGQKRWKPRERLAQTARSLLGSNALSTSQ